MVEETDPDPKANSHLNIVVLQTDMNNIILLQRVSKLSALERWT
jgi:hypothetical protein